MFSWLKKREILKSVTPLVTDIHSHLLPGLDDGVQSLEQSEEILRLFIDLGYKKIITTPHVMADAYRNTYEGILKKLDELNQYLLSKHLSIEVKAAAEYYLDEQLMSLLQNDKPLLTFGDNYLLFETNFLTQPFNLNEFIFLAITKGYKPVLAHPERYLYLQNNFNQLQDLLERGVLFQINISSITGYYSKVIQAATYKMVDLKWVHMLGSDCHHLQHARLVQTAQQMKYYQKAISLPLLNNSL